MNNQFIGNGGETPEEILSILQTNADKTEKTSYFHRLNEDEIQLKTMELVDNTIAVVRFEEELTGIKKQYKGKIDPLKSDNKLLVREIKDKGFTVENADCFVFLDQETRKAGYYNPQGFLVYERGLYPNEITQQGLFKMPKPTKDIVIKPSEMEATGTDGEGAYKFKDESEDPEQF